MRPVAALTGLAVAVIAFLGGEALQLDDRMLLGVPIALGIAAAALTRRFLHRRALERLARGHNARS